MSYLDIIKPHKILYTAFDVHPSAKGASTHIHHFTKALINRYDDLLTYVLGRPMLPTWERVDNVATIRHLSNTPNYLQRAEEFSMELLQVLEGQDQLQVCHFRDIWGGLPILMMQPQKGYKSIFEVNGIPSIELPYRYPLLGTSTLEKFREREMTCLEGADRIIVPSAVIKDHITHRGIDAQKIKIITNGALVPLNTSPYEGAPDQYIIYFGALQRWQGIDTLLKAMILLRDYEDLKLVICAATKPKKIKDIMKFVRNNDLEDRIVWYFQLKKKDLNNLIGGAMLSVAPLKACDRNIKQGCSPLKILESMALGIPVVASDLPAVREIIPDNTLGKLVRPDRPAELARALRTLIDHPEHTKMLGFNAQQHILKDFMWHLKQKQLLEVYEELMKPKES